MLERLRDLFHTVSSDGVLFPHDFLRQIIQREDQLEGLTETAYHLDGVKLNEAISSSWTSLLQNWRLAYDVNRTDRFSRIKKKPGCFPYFMHLGMVVYRQQRYWKKRGKNILFRISGNTCQFTLCLPWKTSIRIALAHVETLDARVRIHLCRNF